jgi:hypothetical protein
LNLAAREHYLANAGALSMPPPGNPAKMRLRLPPSAALLHLAFCRANIPQFAFAFLLCSICVRVALRWSFGTYLDCLAHTFFARSMLYYFQFTSIWEDCEDAE